MASARNAEAIFHLPVIPREHQQQGSPRKKRRRSPCRAFSITLALSVSKG
jgi:hypothetical protein